MTISGHVAPGFGPVRDAFAANFESHGELGAGVAVYVGGELVVDLVGGVADPASGDPYGTAALQVVFSTTQGAAAVCANLLIQRGELDPEALVHDVWPASGQAGQGAPTLAMPPDPHAPSPVARPHPPPPP